MGRAGAAAGATAAGADMAAGGIATLGADLGAGIAIAGAGIGTDIGGGVTDLICPIDSCALRIPSKFDGAGIGLGIVMG